MGDDATTSGEQAERRSRRPYVRPAELEALQIDLADATAHLHQRIDDEMEGLRSSLSASIRDEVDRVDELIAGVGGRLDVFMAKLGQLDSILLRAGELAGQLDVRISEAVELSAQPRAAERSFARLTASLEARIAALEALASNSPAT